MKKILSWRPWSEVADTSIQTRTPSLRSSCDVSLLCLFTIKHHSKKIAGVRLGEGRAYRPLVSGSRRIQDCDEGEARSGWYVQEEQERKDQREG
jgi:hypothetical protein